MSPHPEAIMLEKLKTNPLTSVLGVVEASLVTFLATDQLDKLSWKQALLAYGVALAMAVKGFITADASPAQPKS
jgi:hypothetical protein